MCSRCRTATSSSESGCVLSKDPSAPLILDPRALFVCAHAHAPSAFLLQALDRILSPDEGYGDSMSSGVLGRAVTLFLDDVQLKVADDLRNPGQTKAYGAFR